MAEIAKGYPDSIISLRTISQSQRISLKYLEQVIAVLKAAGLVNSVRGYGGGYKLARPPEETTLHDIYVALEGPPNLVECVDDADTCPMHTECPTRETWVKMSNALSEILLSTTVEDLVKRPSVV